MSQRKGRVVVVTGGARGIGYEIAKVFAEHGDTVVIGDINEAGAKKAALEIGSNTEGYFLDVTKEKSVMKLIEVVSNKYGTIDVLINNAGLQHRDKLENFSLEDWQRLLDVMLTGPFLMTKHVLPFMKKQRFGRIINISSVHGELATPKKAAYVSAKHGVIGLTKTTSLETAQDRITANAILPGPVKTELLIEQLAQLKKEGISESDALELVMWPKQLMKKFLEPEEIADTALFLASNKASSISGECISVSGGM